MIFKNLKVTYVHLYYVYCMNTATKNKIYYDSTDTRKLNICSLSEVYLND